MCNLFLSMMDRMGVRIETWATPPAASKASTSPDSLHFSRNVLRISFGGN